MSDFNTEEFADWWTTEGASKYEGDSKLCALRAWQHQQDKMNALQAEIDDLVEIKDKYYELIFAVGTKFPGETRHETSLKYIIRAEESCSGPAQQAPTTGESDE